MNPIDPQQTPPCLVHAWRYIDYHGESQYLVTVNGELYEIGPISFDEMLAMNPVEWHETIRAEWDRSATVDTIADTAFELSILLQQAKPEEIERLRSCLTTEGWNTWKELISQLGTLLPTAGSDNFAERN